MAEYQRGPYTPGDEPPLTLDRRARAPARPDARQASRAPRRSGPPPVTLVLSLLLLVGVGGAVAFLYRAGLRGPSGPPAPVGTPIHDVRVAAPAQAQPADPAAGLSIYNAAPPAAAPAFAPAPEQPAPRPLPAGSPLAPPAPAASAAAVTPPAEPPPGVVAPKAVVASDTGAAKPAPPKTRSRPRAPATIDSLIAENTLAAPPRRHATGGGDPRAAKAPETPADANEPSAKKPPSVVAHAAVVQIGAFSSRELALAAASHGHPKHILAVTRPDGSVLYRASLAGFASREEAAAFCGKLKAAGSSCFVPR